MNNTILQFLRNYTNWHQPGKQRNAFIFSIPRSGSTWLQELIWTQPGFKYCNEPLNIKGPFLQEKSKIRSFAELYQQESKSKLLDYFYDFHIGKSHFLDPRPTRIYYRPITNRIIFKIIHGGEIHINAIVDHCNGQAIYLIRHPFAVALSRRFLPRMEVLCSPQVMTTFTEAERQLATRIHNHGTHLEKSMVSWCIQNRLALDNRREDWLVFTYEQLVTDPMPVVTRLVEKLELPYPEKIVDRLRIPSAVKTQSEEEAVVLMQSNHDQRQLLTERWKTKIDEQTRVALWEIVLAFGMDIYEPDSASPKAAFLL